MTVRVFIASSPNGEDLPAEITLEYSLRKNCSEDIEIVFMRNKDPETNFFGGFDNSAWATTFTNLRWAIPEYCNFEGRAIYMDVDMINFRDISVLFNMDMEGAPLVCRKGGRTCVTLMDCKKMKNLLPSVAELKKYSAFNNHNAAALASYAKDIDPRWNCFDGEGLPADDIWHLHFTHMPTQPWHPGWAAQTHARHGVNFVSRDHPRPDLVAIWNRTRREAEKELGLRDENTCEHVAIATLPMDKWDAYGSNLLPSFDKNWEKHIPLIVYAENGTEPPVPLSDRVKILPLESELPEVFEFQERNSARGAEVSDLSVVGNFRKQASKFARKAYAILKELENPRARYVWYLDADLETLQPITRGFLDHITELGLYMGALPRVGVDGIYHTECGLMVWDTENPAHEDWCKAYRKCWDEDLLFEFEQWNDCFAFDYATTELTKAKRIGIVDLGGGVNKQSSHPLQDGPLGSIFNHKKGRRKL
jgi:hypothetical protein